MGEKITPSCDAIDHMKQPERAACDESVLKHVSGVDGLILCSLDMAWHVGFSSLRPGFCEDTGVQTWLV